MEDLETSIQNTPPRLELLMEDLETLFQNIPGKPRLEILMEDLETLVQNNPPPHAKIGTSHGGLRNFGPEYPPPPTTQS